MASTIEERLRRYYDERTAALPTRGPGPSAPAHRHVPLTPPDRPRRDPRIRIAMALGAAAAVLVVSTLVVILPWSSRNDGTRPGQAPIALEPVETLPDSVDVTQSPATVVGSTPTQWYRLQPDFDIAWYDPQDGVGPSMLCWRTPVASDCQPDRGSVSPDLVVPTAGGQTLVFVTGDRKPATLEIQLGDGSVQSAPIQWDGQFRWGAARYLLPVGAEVASVGPTYPTSPPDDDATVDGTAIWSLEPATELTAESQSFTALVMRLGCHGGKSAPVDGPEIEINDAEVVVTFTVDPPPGAQACPGNDLVPVLVDLGEPIGDRRLLDGACRPGSPALETAYCPADGDRRTSTAFAWLENGPIASVPAADLLGAYCEGSAALASERPEAYVGSQQQRADVYKLVVVAPPELKEALTTFATFLSSGATTPADPDSNLTENWPDEVQAAIDTITTFNAASC